MGFRKVKSDGTRIELSVVHNIYESEIVKVKNPDKTHDYEKREKLVKQLHVRKWFSKEGITSVEEYVTNDHRISKSRSIVFDKYTSRFYATWHNPSEIMEHLSPVSKSVGFKNQK